MKAVGYIRVSTIDQIDGESLNTQEKEIKKYAEYHNYQLDKVYADKGKSGTKIEYRTDLQDLLIAASKNKFQILIINKISRLARNTKEFLNIVEELSSYGVGLVSVSEQFDTTTPNGKLMITILASFAEFEHSTIREQTQSSRKSMWKSKERYIGKPPYCYKVEGKKNLVINKKEAGIYKSIVNMYLNQGMSMNDIVIELNSKGIKSRQSNKWSSAVISRILKNTAYYGYHPVNQYIYKDGPRGAGTVRTKELKPKSEWIEYPIPALISKVVWDEIQQIITGFNRHKTKGVDEITHKFFLRDVLYCKYCGGRVKHVYGNAKKDGTRPRYYVCHWAKVSPKTLESSNKERCYLPRIPAKELEKYIWKDMMQPFKEYPEETLNRILNTKNFDEKILEHTQIITILSSDFETAKRVKNNLFKLLQNPNLDIDDLSNELEKNKNDLLTIQANLDATKGKLDLLNKQKNEQVEGIEYILNHKQSFKQIIEDLNNLSKDDKKILVESMVYNKHILVDYNRFFSRYIDDEPKPEILYQRLFNQEILKRFSDEGKIRPLSHNHTNNSCTHQRSQCPGN